MRGGTEERAKAAWEVYDLRGCGAVSRRDMTTVVLGLVQLMAEAHGQKEASWGEAEAYCEEQGLSLEREQVRARMLCPCLVVDAVGRTGLSQS